MIRLKLLMIVPVYNGFHHQTLEETPPVLCKQALPFPHILNSFKLLPITKQSERMSFILLCLKAGQNTMDKTCHCQQTKTLSERSLRKRT